MAPVELVSALDEDKDRNFVTALARGLDVLRCYKPHETVLSNTDISKRTGLPKPTVSRLIYTLCKLDYLTLDEASGGYRLGAGVLSLGFSVLSGLPIGDRAKTEMQALRDGPNSNITCAIAERHLTDAIYIAVECSREDVALNIAIGSRLPLFFSAIGRAILVASSDQDRATAFAQGATFAPESVQAQKDSYETALIEYQNRGYCTSYGDWRPDVNGIAVPLKTYDGRVFGLNVGGPAFCVKQKQLETIYAPRLLKAAKSLSK